MSEYKLPSGRASVETEGGFLSEINYSYNATGKDKTIQELLNECLKLQAKVEEDEDYKAAHLKIAELEKELGAEITISNKRWEHIEKLTAALELASLNFNRSTKYGKGWHDALAYVNQAALKEDK